MKKTETRIVDFLEFLNLKWKTNYPIIKARMKPIVKLLIRSGEILDEGMNLIIDKLETKDHTLKASFGRAGKILSSNNDGYVIDGFKSITKKMSRSNVCVIAPSGVGKSQVVVIPSIINIAKSESSMIINNPHGELGATIPYLESIGYEIIDLDLSSENSKFFFNPLLRCIDTSSVNKTASLLLKKGMGGGKNQGDATSNFFNTKSIELIGMLINFLREKDMEDYYNLTNVFHLLENMQANPDGVKSLFESSSEKLRLKYLSFIGASKDTLSSIIATSQAALSFIGNDQNLANLTSQDNIDFEKFRTNKIACFVRIPIGDSEYYQKIAGLFFEQFFSHVFRQKPDEGNDIFVILDEMGAIAPTLSDFSNIISSGRKFRIPILGVLQSENQLFDVYGRNAGLAILNNFNTKVYFSGLYDEADRLEKFLGQYTYTEKGKNDHETKRTRNLMTSDEIRNMPVNQVICISSGIKPLKLQVTPAYKQSKLVRYLKMEPSIQKDMEEELDEEDLEFINEIGGYEVPLYPVPENINGNQNHEAIPNHEYAEKLKEYKEKLKNLEK